MRVLYFFFFLGPAAPLSDLTGYSHCGYVLVLKGLVFPQWKRRVLAVIGSRLFLYPGKYSIFSQLNNFMH